MKNTDNLLTKKQNRKSILTAAIFVLLSGSNSAIAATAWSCGSWITDPTNSCVETKTCTRTACDAGGKISNCRTETKTSTATKANCTPTAGKPIGGVKGFITPGSMARPSSTISSPIKPTRTKPAIGNMHKSKVKSAPPIKSDNKKGKFHKPTVNNVKPTVRNVKPFNGTKPEHIRGLQTPTIKTKPDISIVKNRIHLNKINKAPVIFNNGVVAPIIKPGSGNNAHSVLGGKGFVPANNASKTGSGKNWQSVQEEYTGTTPIIKEISLPLQIFANEMQSAFQGTKIRLNNYGDKHGNTWYKGNDSYVELPASLKVAKQQFSFPAMNDYPFRYYMNDVNLSSVQVDVSLDRLAVEFNFESSGKELKGHCATLVLCPLGEDLTAPDVQINNMKVTVYLTPVARHGSISFSQVDVDFTANIQAQGGCDVVGISSVCDLLTGYKQKIKDTAKNSIKNMIDRNDVRNEVANKMRLPLAEYDIKNITNVSVTNDYIDITYSVPQGQLAMP